MSKSHRATLDDLITAIAENMSQSNLLETVVCLETGDVIRKARKHLGLSQEEFSKKMNVTQSLVSRWESGNCNYTVETLAKIAVELGLTLNCPLTESKASEDTTPQRKFPVGFSLMNTERELIENSHITDEGLMEVAA